MLLTICLLLPVLIGGSLSRNEAQPVDENSANLEVGSKPGNMTVDLHHVGKWENGSIPNSNTDYLRWLLEDIRSAGEVKKQGGHETTMEKDEKSIICREKRQNSKEFLYMKPPPLQFNFRNFGTLSGNAHIKKSSLGVSQATRLDSGNTTQSAACTLDFPISLVRFFLPGFYCEANVSGTLNSNGSRELWKKDVELLAFKRKVLRLNLKTTSDLRRYVKLRKTLSTLHSKSSYYSTSLERTKFFERTMKRIKLRMQALDEDADWMCSARRFPLGVCVYFSFVAFWRELQMLDLITKYYLQEVSYSYRYSDVIQDDVRKVQQRLKTLMGIDYSRWSYDSRAVKIPDLLEDISLVVKDVTRILHQRGR